MVSTYLKRFWPLITLLLLFAASIGVRWQSFSIDPVKDHKWTTYERFDNLEVYEHDHYVGQVYDANPVSVHKFAGYIGTGGTDFLLNKYKGSDGYPLTVYTSFPPTHFVVLYETLRLFGSDISFFGIQMFSLTLHLLCIILVYFLAMELTKKNKYVSVLTATVYIFSTGTLWQHMNVYWAHQLLMPVFLGFLILFVRRKGLLKWWESLIFGLSMSIIAWTGMFAAFGYALYSFYKYYKTKKNEHRKSGAFMLVGTAGALFLIVAQALWATGADFWNYVTHVSNRVSARTGGIQHMPLPRLIWLFVNDLSIDFGGFFIIAWTLALIRKVKGFEWGVLFVATFPITESFLLLEHDEVYGFARLKWLVPALVVTAICGNKFAKTKKQKVMLGAAIAAASVLHAALYFVVYWQ